MGQQIIYCATCGVRILDRDFESRAAFRIDSRGFCRACAPEAIKSLPPDKMVDVLSQSSQAESPPRQKVPARPPSVKSLPAAPLLRRSSGPAPRGGILIAAIAAIAVLIAVLIVAMSGSTPPPAPPPPPPKDAVKPPPKVDREAAAAQALRLAREYRDANPKDVATQIASFERVVSDYKGTRAADEARRDLEELQRRRAEDALAAELKALEEQAAAAATADALQKAVGTLKESRGRHPDASWTAGIDRLVQETQGRAAALPPPPPAEMRPLINGKDLTGWEVTRGRWEFKDGMLQAVALDDKSRTNIHTVEQFGDYELEGLLETTVRTYTEVYCRGLGWMIAIQLDPGLHRLRVVAKGDDVKLFLDDDAVKLTRGTARTGDFGLFALNLVKLKNVKVRP